MFILTWHCTVWKNYSQDWWLNLSYDIYGNNMHLVYSIFKALSIILKKNTIMKELKIIQHFFVYFILKSFIHIYFQWSATIWCFTFTCWLGWRWGKTIPLSVWSISKSPTAFLIGSLLLYFRQSTIKQCLLEEILF